MQNLSNNTLFWIVAILFGCALQAAIGQPQHPVSNQPNSEQKAFTAFLVRHAEKVDQSRDPVLSEVGTQRAKVLSNMLRNADIRHIHSSDFIRTRETAAPLAEMLGLEILLYDPRDLQALATRIRETGGRHLVVGHSNTTPALTEILGGEAGSAIDEPKEYDRLYIVTQSRSGEVSSVLMRYGQPYLEK